MVSYVSIPHLSKCIETRGPVSKFIVSTSIAIACSTTIGIMSGNQRIVAYD